VTEPVHKEKDDPIARDTAIFNWEQEYSHLQIIPSSTREFPSKALTLFSELIDYRTRRDVLEPGCGTGRNAIYLARKGCRVTAVDFSPIALRKLAERARLASVEQQILPCFADLSHRFPFGDECFDLCVDSYVSCHFIDDESIRHYWSQVRRVTRTGGLIYSCVFAEDDGYYREFAREDDIVIDPNNRIAKKLYREKEIKAILCRYFSLRYFAKFEFTDVVLDRHFIRRLYVLLLER
jgi:SAM-dependent methyltransferase